MFHRNSFLHVVVKINTETNVCFHAAKSHPAVQAASLEEFDMNVKIEVKEEDDESSEEVGWYELIKAFVQN